MVISGQNKFSDSFYNTNFTCLFLLDNISSPTLNMLKIQSVLLADKGMFRRYWFFTFILNISLFPNKITQNLAGTGLFLPFTYGHNQFLLRTKSTLYYNKLSLILHLVRFIIHCLGAHMTVAVFWSSLSVFIVHVTFKIALLFETLVAPGTFERKLASVFHCVFL